MAIANAKHYFEVPEIGKLDVLWSEEILIHGIPWKIMGHKVVQNEQLGLSVCLICANNDESTDWALWGSASFKLLPSRIDLLPSGSKFLSSEKHTGPFVFDASGHGRGSQIWPTNHFTDQLMKDGKLILEVQLSAENPNDPKRSRLNFGCVQKSSDFA